MVDLSFANVPGWLFVVLGFFLAALVFLLWRYLRIVPEGKEGSRLSLKRLPHNPILGPIAKHWWESEAVFNPAAFCEDGIVHLFYRAMGHDGISRIGYASSKDGIHFDERLPYPVYDQGPGFQVNKVNGKTERKYQQLSYNTQEYASGGGWGGCEDPRAVKIDNKMYMSFTIFEGWESIRLAVTSLLMDDLKMLNWKWAPHIKMSPLKETHKNWVLFPEKIDGKFAILHALTPNLAIEYVDTLEELHTNPLKSNNKRGGRKGEWDAFVRGAASPPVKTEYGWLLFYHGMDPATPAVGYKVGVMLLDLADPTKVLYRSSYPVLEPTEWYENDWKPGVVYASGATIVGDDLFIYYGGGDKYIAAAKANLKDFIRKLQRNEHAVLEPIRA